MITSAQTQTSFASGEVRGFTKYAIYDDTGRIIKYGKARDIVEDNGASMAEQCEVGQSAIAVSAWPDPATMYIPGGVITTRPVCPITAAVVGHTVNLISAPVGAAYAVSGSASLSGITIDSTPSFVFAAAGVYTISVACFPAQDFAQGFTLS